MSELIAFHNELFSFHQSQGLWIIHVASIKIERQMWVNHCAREYYAGEDKLMRVAEASQRLVFALVYKYLRGFDEGVYRYFTRHRTLAFSCLFPLKDLPFLVPCKLWILKNSVRVVFSLPFKESALQEVDVGDERLNREPFGYDFMVVDFTTRQLANGSREVVFINIL